MIKKYDEVLDISVLGLKKVKKNNLYGLLNLNNELIVNCEFFDIDILCDDGFAVIYENSYAYLYDIKAKKILKNSKAFKIEKGNNHINNYVLYYYDEKFNYEKFYDAASASSNEVIILNKDKHIISRIDYEKQIIIDYHSDNLCDIYNLRRQIILKNVELLFTDLKEFKYLFVSKNNNDDILDLETGELLFGCLESDNKLINLIRPIKDKSNILSVSNEFIICLINEDLCIINKKNFDIIFKEKGYIYKKKLYLSTPNGNMELILIRNETSQELFLINCVGKLSIPLKFDCYELNGKLISTSTEGKLIIFKYNFNNISKYNDFVSSLSNNVIYNTHEFSLYPNTNSNVAVKCRNLINNEIEIFDLEKEKNYKIVNNSLTNCVSGQVEVNIDNLRNVIDLKSGNFKFADNYYMMIDIFDGENNCLTNRALLKESLDKSYIYDKVSNSKINDKPYIVFRIVNNFIIVLNKEDNSFSIINVLTNEICLTNICSFRIIDNYAVCDDKTTFERTLVSLSSFENLGVGKKFYFDKGNIYISDDYDNCTIAGYYNYDKSSSHTIRLV